MPPLGLTGVERLPLTASEALSIFLSHVEERYELYPAQEEALLAIFEDYNVILKTPTGSGKSLIAQGLHYRALTAGRNSIYTSPIKALVNEKFLDFCRLFGPENVGLLTGDGSVNSEAPILCCTAEILAQQALRLGDEAHIGDVVLDEFHYYADRQRGTAWQVPLLTLPQCRFLLMSATMGESYFFKKTLENLTKRPTVEIFSRDRPVPLEYQYSEDSFFETLQDLLDKQKCPIYVVNFTQKQCSEKAMECLRFSMLSREEKAHLHKELACVKFSSPYGKELKRLLRQGIGVHHGGLLPRYRLLVEKMAQKGLLKLIMGTDTLGVGVNIPIRTVVFTQLSKFDGEKNALIRAREFHQIAGRAGRRGFDTQGMVVALAPAHIVEQKKNQARGKPHKPPPKGFVSWNQENFWGLCQASPEPLRSSFQITHSMILNVLSREKKGCEALKQILSHCHESAGKKVHLRHLTVQLVRSLRDRKILDFQREGSVVNGDLQDDFSLHHHLSLFLLDALRYLDPCQDGYELSVLSLVESILENPDAILRRQADMAKNHLIANLKTQGVEFSDRMKQADKVAYPKPMADFIYGRFQNFTTQHPWVGHNNISPKGIAREIYETYQSFGEYVRSYALEKSEGVLLRYLSDVYKTLVQTVPQELKNDAFDEMVAYFETMIRSTDSSLLDEWRQLRDPSEIEKTAESLENLGDFLDITQDLRGFSVLVRGTLFEILRNLSLGSYEAIPRLCGREDPTWRGLPPPEDWQRWMAIFSEDHGSLRIHRSSFQPRFFHVSRVQKEYWAEMIIPDEKGYYDWVLKAQVDLESSRHLGVVVLSFLSMGAIGEV